MVYGLPPDDDVPPPAPVLVVSSACTAPRDISALRGPAAMHPWRTVRKRNHRLLPQRCERRPFPKSLPRRTVISAPRATVLALHDSPPISVPTLPTPSLDPGRSVQPAHLLGLTPLHPDDPIHPDDVASIDMTAPSLCPCPADHFIGPPISLPPALPPVFPAQTTYGPVRSSLALACAGEKACIDGVSQIFDIVWGPYPSAMLQNYLAELPGDQLVFLCMLAEFAALEPVFDGFLRPAIVDFAKGWVTHCLQQDSHG
ncbi:hypothetical protein B0H15DRAFT_842763 [Mycena belliarum]|uniref:Uncharacterized protein n=1 Tax=Mycena belliarum TaxID=1033014 RepID=A0AAD6XNS0_9AGAR|nr:hypothetical protein B0H15DRAFT_842763 [Mycena belliae]